MRDILSEYKIDNAVLAGFQKDFEQLIAKEDFTISFKGEKLSMYDDIQHCFTDDKIGGGHLRISGDDHLRLVYGMVGYYPLDDVKRLLHILFTHPNKQQSIEMADRFHAFLEKIAKKTPAEIRAEGTDIEQEAMAIIKGNILLEILCPIYWRFIELGHRNRIDVESTLPIIALLRYQQDTGDYPQDLDTLLTTGYLKKIPTDPFSDKPIVYKKTADSFMLYSVGTNFTDDNGHVDRHTEGRHKGKIKIWSNQGDWLFWPTQY